MSDNVSENVWVGGTWYGPDYPDAGDPPQAGAKKGHDAPAVGQPSTTESAGEDDTAGVTRGRPKRRD